MAYITPTGPYEVGAMSRELADPDRPAYLSGTAPGRTLRVKVWYPAERTVDIEPSLVWDELREDDRTPLPVRLMLTCLRSRTAARSQAQFSSGVRAARLVIYSHAYVSFASENGSLLEELASHGYVALSVEHREQLAEMKSINRDPNPEKNAYERLTQRLKRASRAERAKLAPDYYAASRGTNRIVIERSRDVSFLLDRIAEVLAQIPGLETHQIGAHRAHLIGYSVGGAVSTETAKRDPRILSVVSLDGGMQGTMDGAAIQGPYLMMYSSANDGMNERLLPDHAVRITPPNTTHINYHDIAMLMPVLRYMRVTGPTNPKTFIQFRNRTVREFVSTVTTRF